MAEEKVSEGRLTVTVAEAGRMLGVSRSLAFQLARQGVIPTLKLGSRRLVVPKVALQRMLSEAGSGKQTEKEVNENERRHS